MPDPDHERQFRSTGWVTTSLVSGKLQFLSNQIFRSEQRREIVPPAWPEGEEGEPRAEPPPPSTGRSSEPFYSSSSFSSSWDGTLGDSAEEITQLLMGL